MMDKNDMNTQKQVDLKRTQMYKMYISFLQGIFSLLFSRCMNIT